MKTIWLLNDPMQDDSLSVHRTYVVREALRRDGFITRVDDDVENMAEKACDGDVVLTTFWDSRIIELKDALIQVAIKRKSTEKQIEEKDVDLSNIQVPSVKLAAILPWGPVQASKPLLDRIQLEDDILHCLDVAMVRCHYEKEGLLATHAAFEDDEVKVIGGSESLIQVLNLTMATPWESRKNRITFPFAMTDENGYSLFKKLRDEYTSAFPDEKVEWIELDGRVTSRYQLLTEYARTKVVFSGKIYGWPTELIEASMLGAYPLVHDFGALGEVVSNQESKVDFSGAADEVSKLRHLFEKPQACNAIAFSSPTTVKEVLQAL